MACGPEKLSELMRLAARANAFPAGANLPSLESLQGGNELSNLMEADNVMHALVGGEHGGGSPHAAVRAVFRGEVPEEQAFDLLRCVSSLKRLKQRNALASELRHCLQPKARGPEVLYNVGAVLRHLKFGWHGVVCGYDDTCAMPDPWLEQNYSPTGQKHDIEVVRRSPFYSLACNDGIHRYASQLTHELVEGNSASFFGLSESDVPEPPQLTGPFQTLSFLSVCPQLTLLLQAKRTDSSLTALHLLFVRASLDSLPTLSKSGSRRRNRNT